MFNRFYGSLEPLKDLIKLVELSIQDTDIDEGLEYLSSSLERFYCFSNRKDAKVRRISKVLEPFNGSVKKWRAEGKPLLNREEELENQLQLLQNKFIQENDSEKIKYLEFRIKELSISIKKHKEKIVNAYLYFAPEKKLLQKLIIAHLKLTKFKKQGVPSFASEEECWEIKKELKEKIGIELIEKVQLVLSDCEELVNWELELETKLNDKTSLLERNQIPQITTYYDESKFITYHDQIIQEITDAEQNTVKPTLKHFLGKGGHGKVYYGEWKL